MSFGGCDIVVWDVDMGVRCVWDEEFCRGFGCCLTAWAYEVADVFSLLAPVVMWFCVMHLSRSLG